MNTPKEKVIRVQIEPAAIEVLQGKLEVHGDLEIADDHLLFSYRTKNFFGKFSEEMRLKIAFEDISSVTLKRGFVATKILIYPRQLGIMKDMPGEHRSDMRFKVAGHDRQKAGAFVSYLQYKTVTQATLPVSSVPFTLESTDMGLTEHEGLLYLEEEFLVFDLQSGFSGGRKEDRHLVKIEPAAIREVQIKPGTLNDHLFIWPKKDDLLEAIPGNHQAGKIKLTVKRKYRDELEKMLGLMLHG